MTQLLSQMLIFIAAGFGIFAAFMVYLHVGTNRLLSEHQKEWGVISEQTPDNDVLDAYIRYIDSLPDTLFGQCQPPLSKRDIMRMRG